MGRHRVDSDRCNTERYQLGRAGTSRDEGSGNVLSDVVGEQIARWRRESGMNREELAERCRELGLPKMSPSVITNIESGRRVKGSPRRTVSVDELVVFALALSVPISRLMVPYPDQGTMELTPSAVVPTTDVLAWLAGDKFLDVARDADQPRWKDARMLPAAIGIHNELMFGYRRWAGRVARHNESLQSAVARSTEAQAILDAAERGEKDLTYRGQPVEPNHLELLRTGLLMSRETESLIRRQLDDAVKQLRTMEQSALMFREAMRERGFPVPQLEPDTAHLEDAVPDEEFKKREWESLSQEWRGEV